jgi:hypothetical protein
MPKKIYLAASLLLTLSLLLSACAEATPSPTPGLDINAAYTLAAATIQAGFTQTALAMPTATLTPVPSTATLEPPTATPPLPSPTAPTGALSAAATPTPYNSAEAYGCYNATFMGDLGTQNGLSLNPGDKFTKTWQLKNTGTCPWTDTFTITYWSGDMFGADTTKIRAKLPPGGVLNISLPMIAPNASGTVSSSWRMATDDGHFFGTVLTAIIVLPGGGTSTGGCYSAVLAGDISTPNGAKLSPGEAFTKTWRVQNTGTCAWKGSFKITFVGGDMLGADTTKIRKTVEPGASVEISLDMLAPSTTGNVEGYWQLATDAGDLFGPTFSVVIVVK